MIMCIHNNTPIIVVYTESGIPLALMIIMIRMKCLHFGGICECSVCTYTCSGDGYIFARVPEFLLNGC